RVVCRAVAPREACVLGSGASGRVCRGLGVQGVRTGLLVRNCPSAGRNRILWRLETVRSRPLLGETRVAGCRETSGAGVPRGPGARGRERVREGRPPGQRSEWLEARDAIVPDLVSRSYLVPAPASRRRAPAARPPPGRPPLRSDPRER